MSPKIYPSITTTSSPVAAKDNWRSLIAEVSQLGLTEICFFPTVLSPKERQEAYALLEQSTIKNIPFVHLRSDMTTEELRYLSDRFQTKIFNIHSEKQFPLTYDLSAWRSKIYIETTLGAIPETELKNYAGLCVDISHLEMFQSTDPALSAAHRKLLAHYPIGCWHISAVREENGVRRAPHNFQNLSDFDYVVNYRDFIPPIIALELENSLAEQLRAKDYIEKKLGLS